MQLRRGIMSFKPSDASLYVLLSHLLYLVFEHTLDFVAHGFSAGITKMDAHLVGDLADFLFQRGGVLKFHLSGSFPKMGTKNVTGFCTYGVSARQQKRDTIDENGIPAL